MTNNTSEVQFVSLSEDGAFKTLWLLGSDEVKIKLKGVISKIMGYDISNYETIGIELGKVTYESILNKADLLLLKRQEKKLLNIELNTSSGLSYVNKNNSYLYKIAGEYYNYVGMKSKDNYKTPISVSQLNINCFKCSGSKTITTSVFKMVDMENSQVDESITKINIYIDKSLEKCYDESEKNDYLMFICESYEEMETRSKGDKGGMAIMENLKRLGGDIAFTDHINSTIDNKIIERQIWEEEIEKKYRKAFREAKKELKEQYSEKGREEGLAKGRSEEKNKMILSLFSEGISLDVISKVANLDVGVVQDIIKNGN